MLGVLFVCTGNICRSPTAEGVLRARLAAAAMADSVTVDSAGTGGWHVGDPPDSRAVAAARRRGVDLSGQRARKITIDDFALFDLIVGMDHGHLRHLQAMSPAHPRAELRLFLDFAPHHRGQPVPDPYYGAAGGFEEVLDLIEAGVDGLIRDLHARLDRASG